MFALPRTRVLQAQAQLGITRADQLPSLSAGGNITSQRSPQNGPIPSFESTRGQLNASAAWNLDFWEGIAGQLRLRERTCWRTNGRRKK